MPAAPSRLSANNEFSPALRSAEAQMRRLHHYTVQALAFVVGGWTIVKNVSEWLLKLIKN
jgi:hypothetical protein